MKLTAKQENILGLIGELQLHIQGYSDEPFYDEISFEYEGHHIVNPLVDETASYSVDPIEYYGKAFLNSRFMNLI